MTDAVISKMPWLLTMRTKYEEAMLLWSMDHPISYFLFGPVIRYVFVPVAIFVLMPFTMTITSALLMYLGLGDMIPFIN